MLNGHWNVKVLNSSVLNVKSAFNPEKALEGAFSVITNLRMDLRFKLYPVHRAGHQAEVGHHQQADTGHPDDHYHLTSLQHCIYYLLSSVYYLLYLLSSVWSLERWITWWLGLTAPWITRRHGHLCTGNTGKSVQRIPTPASVRQTVTLLLNSDEVMRGHMPSMVCS